MMFRQLFDQLSGTYSYLLASRPGGEALIIDPVLDFDMASARTSTASAMTLLDHVQAHGLDVQWILETHAHADHLSAGDWLRQHPEGFPPIVVNISDGQPTDGDPTGIASELRGMRSTDGQVLLLNVHLSAHTQHPIQFPSSDAGLPDAHARLLFQLSSPLTPGMLSAAREEGLQVGAGARGFVFNADIISLIKFLNIGTRPSNLR